LTERETELVDQQLAVESKRREELEDELGKLRQKIQTLKTHISNLKSAQTQAQTQPLLSTLHQLKE
jgi:phage shock protein A